MNTRQTTVKPVILEVAILNALARVMRNHGVENSEALAHECLTDLMGVRTVEPPEGIPASFTFKRVVIHWPVGLNTRVPTEKEVKVFNDLVRSLPNYSQDSKLTTDDNVAQLREAYIALWNRHKVEQHEAATKAERKKAAAAQAELPEIDTLPVSTIEPVAPVNATLALLKDLEAQLENL